MITRLLAAFCCALAARRWPRLRFVVAALAVEQVAPYLMMRTSIVASLAWSMSSIIVACAGSSFGTTPRRTVVIVGSLHVLAVIVAPSAAWQLGIAMVVSTATCIALLRHTRPRNVDRCVLAMMLASNASTAATTLAIGIDKAYANNVVGTSNITAHLAITGLVLWAIRPR